MWTAGRQGKGAFLCALKSDVQRKNHYNPPTGTRIQVTGQMGEYYKIRSLETNGIRGYVHKEDAFFGSAR